MRNDDTADQFDIPLSLKVGEAIALGVFCKRLSFAEIKANAITDNEAITIVHALAKLNQALHDMGFSS